MTPAQEKMYRALDRLRTAFPEYPATVRILAVNTSMTTQHAIAALCGLERCEETPKRVVRTNPQSVLRWDLEAR